MTAPRRPPTAKSPYADSKVPTAKAKAPLSEIDRWYDRMPWRRCKASVLTCNPICQRLLENGEQCHNAARIVHHLISPHVARSFFFDWRILVALCPEHHETTEGENLTAPHRYAITNGLLGATADPNAIIWRLQQGLLPQ